MERIEMNQEERDWLDWLKRAKDGVITQRVAAEKMGVTERWVRALLVKMKTKGDAAVIHGLRGRESNRRIEEGIKEQTMKILKLIAISQGAYCAVKGSFLSGTQYDNRL